MIAHAQWNIPISLHLFLISEWDKQLIRGVQTKIHQDVLGKAREDVLDKHTEELVSALQERCFESSQKAIGVMAQEGHS